MRKLKPFGRFVRAVILLLLLAGTALLYKWSRSADPRFYRFVDTPHGRFLAKLFRWYDSPVPEYDENKDESEWTEQEKNIQKTLEARLAEKAPTHCLYLENNKHMKGYLLEEHEDYVLFEEEYGDSGSLEVKVQRSRIKRIEKLASDLPEITYKDVRFQMEFPMMELYKRPPYTIATDESFFYVERSVRVLQRLHAQFVDQFGELIARPRKGENIQLAFFSDEASFRRYQKRYAPHMPGCLGFYSPALDRFLVYNEAGSEMVQGIGASIEATGNEYQAQNPEQAAKVNRWKRESQRKLAAQAEQRTFTTIRHEGAHQLFFTYGIHSDYRMENDWLVEGLATYCEGAQVGELQPDRVDYLRKRLERNAFFGFQGFFDMRGPTGFSSFEDGERIDLAYCEAWALVHMLMQQEYRSGFFEFIKFVRDPENLDETARQSQVDLLCRFLQTTPTELQARWVEYVQRL